MSGTFVFYSWDVMEPISYCMMLGNFTVATLFFARYKDEMQLTTLKDLLKGKFANGLYKRRKLDIERMRHLESEIIELR